MSKILKTTETTETTETTKTTKTTDTAETMKSPVISEEDAQVKFSKKKLTELKQNAQAYKIKGYSKMNKAELVQALAKLFAKPNPVSEDPEAFFKPKKNVKDINVKDINVSENNMDKVFLQNQNLTELKILCKKKDIKGYSGKNKASIIELIVNSDKKLNTSKSPKIPKKPKKTKKTKKPKKVIPDFPIEDDKDIVKNSDDESISDTEVFDDDDIVNVDNDDEDDSSKSHSDDSDSIGEDDSDDDDIIDNYNYMEPSDSARFQDVLQTEKFL